MKLIRNSTFETNSSSCHSISISSGTDVYAGYTPDEYGTIVLPQMEFGWSEKVYGDVESKLAYVYIYIRDWCGDKATEFRSIFEEIVFAHTGATSIVMEDGGYIDHQSVESGDLHYLFDDKQLLKDFLFNKNSFIETDNDNR